LLSAGRHAPGSRRVGRIMEVGPGIKCPVSDVHCPIRRRLDQRTAETGH
jgi:hypothetical protein